MNDTTAVVKELRRRGYSVRQAKNGHWNVRDTAGKLITVISFSPKRKPSKRVLMRYLRKAGIEL